MKRSTQVLGILFLLVSISTLTVVQTDSKIISEGILDTEHRAKVRTAFLGRVLAVKVNEGDFVRRGQVLAILGNPDLANSLSDLQSQLREQQIAEARIRYDGDLGKLVAQEARLAELREHIRQSQRNLDRLILRSPQDGYVVTSRLHERIGEFLLPGATLLELADTDRLLARLLIPENDIVELALQQKVAMRFPALPDREFSGTVVAIAPARQSQDNSHAQITIAKYEVKVSVPDPEGHLKLGMSGIAKIRGARRSIARHAIHWVGKTFNPDFW
ncbi:MAG: efflux RND transporter periplasmic adaptor subunit [Cyanobacteria bacterium NC_groundwater_1444_Ag_S-0.65um_54_12]|nr:efflux RND transporter periplasmic adaptor subunit [Cyanobacteria bacterium NC_groundwater_1444_Ag_S-0.65um_54_12]